VGEPGPAAACPKQALLQAGPATAENVIGIHSLYATLRRLNWMPSIASDGRNDSTVPLLQKDDHVFQFAEQMLRLILRR
jgi:hypothetical protein